MKGPVIGITGSNGKTTTTALTAHVLPQCGIACQVGGNIGTAVTSLIDSSSDDQWNVLELSSFQLETITQFSREDRRLLERHARSPRPPPHIRDSMRPPKARLFETQSSGDFAVLNHDDPVCRGFAAKTTAQIYWFSLQQQVANGVWLKNEEIFWNGEPFMTRSQIRLRGLHNVENVMCTAVIAHLAGAPLSAIGPAVQSFPGVEHRIEFVRSLNGVDYFNDSKATNVDATLKAIDAFPGGLWIILGGKDKGSDYSPLVQPLRERAKAALLIGAATPLIKAALDSALPLVDCGTLANAVAYAHEDAQPGDTVLLAPACASFDQFQNYEERGRTFKQLVKELS